MWESYSLTLDDYNKNTEDLKKNYLKLKEKDEALLILQKKSSTRIKKLSVSIEIRIIESNGYQYCNNNNNIL